MIEEVAAGHCQHRRFTESNGEQSMDTANLKIRGMNSCASIMGVERALSVIRGVEGVEISPDDSTATVIYDAYKVIPKQFQIAVRLMGCEIENLDAAAPQPFSLPAGTGR